MAEAETDADVIAALRLGLEAAADDRTALRLVRALLEMAPPTEGRAARAVACNPDDQRHASCDRLRPTRQDREAPPMKTHWSSPIFLRTRCGLPLTGLPTTERYKVVPVTEQATCGSCQRSERAHRALTKRLEQERKRAA
jgi:hypothetical protein